MASEVEKNVFYVLVLIRIWPKKMGVPKSVFDVVKRRTNGLQRDIKANVEAFWQREIFDLEIVKYLNFSKCLTTHSLICLFWLTSCQSNWPTLIHAFTKDVSMCVYTLKAIGQIQLYWELYIICPSWSNFYGKSVINPWGWPTSSLKDPNHKPVCLFQIWVDPLS